MIALRGNGGLMLEVRGLRDQLQKNRKEYCVIVLFGKIKGEDQYIEY